MDTTEHRRIEREISELVSGADPFAAAIRASRMPMVITDPRQADNPIVFANDAFCKLTGYGREEILGKNCRFLQGPATNADDVIRLKRAIAERKAIELDLLNYRRDGSVFWNRLLVSPVFDGEQLTYFLPRSSMSRGSVRSRQSGIRKIIRSSCNAGSPSLSPMRSA